MTSIIEIFYYENQCFRFHHKSVNTEWTQVWKVVKNALEYQFDLLYKSLRKLCIRNQICLTRCMIRLESVVYCILIENQIVS